MKVKGKNIKLWLIILLCIVIVLPAGWFAVVKLEGGAPALSVSPASPVIGASGTIGVTISDEKSGLRRVWVGLYQDGNESVLLDRDFPANILMRRGTVRQKRFDMQVEPAKLGISDGNATLRIMARDCAWRRWWHGNKAYREVDVRIDTTPPEIEVLTRFHNITRGGSGVVIYRLSEPCDKSGVVVGKDFYPGYAGRFSDPAIRTAFFALGYDQGKDTQVFLKATDPAGNSARSGFPHHIRHRNFKSDTIRISDNFLNLKMPEIARENQHLSGNTPIAQFLEINRRMRKTNYETIVEICRQTDDRIYWKGRFLRLPNAATRAGFADQRDYVYQNEIIDHQVHLGIDLASVAHSPIPAANHGRVLYTGRIGIYGKTVLIDHGFGLFSMYSHLSAIDVQPEQMVAKNEIIGRTGKTGLAGGDHLHFSMLVNHRFVNPLEWWDDSWIHNNVTSKIDDVGTVDAVGG